MPRFLMIFFLLLAPFGALADATAPDPLALALIKDIGLRESATASRDLPGWSPPKKIVER